jgi:WD40 repeat protein
MQFPTRKWALRFLLALAPAALFVVLMRQVRWLPKTMQQRQVLSLVFSPNGKWLVAEDVDAIHDIYDVQSGKEVTVVGRDVTLSSGDMAIVADGERYVTDRDPMSGKPVTKIAKPWVALWNFQTGQPVGGVSADWLRAKQREWQSQQGSWQVPIQERSTIPGQQGEFTVGEWPDGKMLACGRGATQTLRLFDARTGRLLHVLQESNGPASPVEFSRDGSTIASYGDDNNKSVVRAFAVDNGKLLREIPFNDRSIFALSPDGRTLAVGDYWGEIKLYPLRL